MRQIVIAMVLAAHVCAAFVASAQGLPQAPGLIRVEGRAESVVTESVIRFGDVAQIESANVQNDEAIIQL